MSEQITVWEFRANYDLYTRVELTKFMNRLAKRWVFQHEKGEKEGYHHWQGRMSLWKQRRKNELMKLMQGMEMAVPNYLAPTAAVNHKKEAFYCMKEDTRIDGPYTNEDQVDFIPKIYQNVDLYPFQKTIIESKAKPFERAVNLIYDKKGCQGKTVAMMVAHCYSNAIILPQCNDGEKLIQSLCNILIAKQNHTPGLLFVDLPRAMNQEKLAGMYGALEVIKTGWVYDMRNHFKDWRFDPPTIWVFTNTKPLTAYLTPDRWKIWHITEEKELVPYRKRARESEEQDG